MWQRMSLQDAAYVIRQHGWEARQAPGMVLAVCSDDDQQLFIAGKDGLISGCALMRWLGY